MPDDIRPHDLSDDDVIAAFDRLVEVVTDLPLVRLRERLEVRGSWPELSAAISSLIAVFPASDDERFRMFSVPSIRTELDPVQIASSVTSSVPSRDDRVLIAKLILDSAFEPAMPESISRLDALARGKTSILNRLVSIKAGDAGKILAPNSSESRSTIKRMRDEGRLLGLPVGQRPDYLYPNFQFDRSRHRIVPIVAYANQTLGARDDPWGVASWWLTASDLFDGASPQQLLDAGRLTRTAIDNVAAADAMGM